MSTLDLVFLILLFFFTSVIGVVTGGNSLITVPVMFAVGIDEKTAVATNMFGLTFMAIGGAIPFLRQGAVDVKKLSPMIILTIVGSAMGAAIVGLVTNEAIKLVVTVGMIGVVVFSLLSGKGIGVRSREEILAGSEEQRTVPKKERQLITLIGFILVFLLAIYGGLYSGGYVTILTAVLVAFFGMTYSGSIAATKVLNVFSSSIATAVFIYQGLVNFWLGAILAVTMFAGAYVGAHYATKMNEVVLRRIFLSAVVLLVLKAIVDYAT
jgi:uncharacterized membrane protein YfcA